ncbi:23516_t:CDS:1 [Racocetra persica]|uniref:23516_t:CDS:1 n=1 Tax=Racocetra persica TaxID=160502 RepID=A0ACA9NP48_9GLOM|nr:23516_t:CDS:1 [Racocetra persica]
MWEVDTSLNSQELVYNKDFNKDFIENIYDVLLSYLSTLIIENKHLSIQEI